MKQGFEQIITFIIELEKLKAVMRKTRPPGLQRYENSAEHSWQIALLGLSLAQHSQADVDVLKVVTMLLLHDIVEIDTGDKFAYSDNHDDYDNELQAAKRLFAMLPEPLNAEYLSLWEEFEVSLTPEAKFAKAVDRMMPVLQNLHNGCHSWRENDISVKQVLAKNAIINEVNSDWWQVIESGVRQAAKKSGIREQ